MGSEMGRPFYDEYAWAYDFVITPPDEARLDFIAETFARRGVAAGARLLDAGCGAGRYAVGLARRGYAVEGVDLSTRLVAEARALASKSGLAVSFRVGDILELTATKASDAILCRGVLNDLTDEAGRERAFQSFAGALRRGGALLLDVREWEATARGKSREPVFEKTVETPRGALTFRSVTRVEEETRRLFVDERHALKTDGGAESLSTYEFVMRCWTREELEARLARAGFGSFEFFGGYERGATVGSSDRLVCAASLE